MKLCRSESAANDVLRSYNRPCERVEHVSPLGRAEKSRENPTVSPDRITRAFHCDVIARNHSNVPKFRFKNPIWTTAVR
ncbi:hypothetical protein EVAR_53456_1 [Eumeta japonica]|uniref:Uncharacterized protein n=1 Tax=Eumeta variegata TaxID=151549 RepID=A0A4C1XTY1_EUMVA|nr:hypothetical protein EVAR_53456_1 [Eumeta japonica]